MSLDSQQNMEISINFSFSVYVYVYKYVIGFLEKVLIN